MDGMDGSSGAENETESEKMARMMKKINERLYGPPPEPLEPEKIGEIVARIGVGPISNQTDFVRELLIHLALNGTPLSLTYLNRRFGQSVKRLNLGLQGILDRAEAAGLIKMRYNATRKKTYIYSRTDWESFTAVARETQNIYFFEESEADADMTPAQQRKQIEERRAAREVKPVLK